MAELVIWRIPLDLRVVPAERVVLDVRDAGRPARAYRILRRNSAETYRVGSPLPSVVVEPRVGAAPSRDGAIGHRALGLGEAPTASTIGA